LKIGFENDAGNASETKRLPIKEAFLNHSVDKIY